MRTIRLSRALATAATLLALTGSGAHALTEAQWANALQNAQPMEKRVSKLPAEFGRMSSASEPAGTPVIAPAGTGEAVVPAANVSTSVIEPKNYGCLPATTVSCDSGTNLNTIYHYSDYRLDPTIVTRDPYRRAGFFVFTFNNTNFFYCTATLISKSILVMAAHCVHDTTANKYIVSGRFYPACVNCNGGGTLSQPYGHADMVTGGRWATAGWVGAANESAGLDQGYDVAVVTLGKKAGTSKEMGSVVGWMAFCYQNCLRPYFQLSQLGFPSNYDGGNRMQYGEHIEQSDTRDYIFGSGMEGGSSGGPHISNLGTLVDSSASKGQVAARNVVFAVTSWGFLDAARKIQGASSLSGPGNINNFKTLFNAACTKARQVHGTASCTLLP